MKTSFIRTVVALGAVASIAAGAALAGSSASVVTVKTTNALGAKILITAKGLTLYHFTDETKGKIDCTGACTKLWPPLLVPAGAKPKAGAGIVVSKLGEIKRPDGTMQVTYNGLALYRFSSDTKPGQTNGQGIESAWYAVTSAGTITKAKATTAAAATSDAPAPATSPAPASSPAPAPYNY